MYENRSNAYQNQSWKQKYLTHKLVLQSINNFHPTVICANFKIAILKNNVVQLGIFIF